MSKATSDSAQREFNKKKFEESLMAVFGPEASKKLFGVTVSEPTEVTKNFEVCFTEEGVPCNIGATRESELVKLSESITYLLLQLRKKDREVARLKSEIREHKYTSKTETDPTIQMTREATLAELIIGINTTESELENGWKQLESLKKSESNGTTFSKRHPLDRPNRYGESK